MSELPLEAATKDVIARYNKGNDMLASAAIALRRLKERVDSGEAGPEWDWPAYRTMHLEPHITKRWINVQLQLAPPGATEAEVGENVERRREVDREAHKKSRERRHSHLTRTGEYSQAEPNYEEPVRQIDADEQPAPEPSTQPDRPTELHSSRSGSFNTVKGIWPTLTAEEKAEFLSWVHDNEYDLYHERCREHRSSGATFRDRHPEAFEEIQDLVKTKTASPPKFTEEQIAAMRSEYEAGAPLAKVARMHGIRYLAEAKTLLGIPE